MKLDLPMLPVSIELRWRPLKPLRFSIRSLLILTLVAAGFFGLLAELRRHNRAIAYHNQQIFEEFRNLSGHPLGSPALRTTRISPRQQAQFRQELFARNAIDCTSPPTAGAG